MKHVITDGTMEQVLLLAQLAPEEAEREQARQDMARMLDFVDQLNELDTGGVSPLISPTDAANVMRDDVAAGISGEFAAAVLSNAPESEDGLFRVPLSIAPEGDA